MENNNYTCTGEVTSIIANLVMVKADGSLKQNEICYFDHEGKKIMGEVIKTDSNNAYVQVFESTRRFKVGTKALFTGVMLEAYLGPGLLSKNFDGLQNDLDKMEGVFLKRGERSFPLENDKEWAFKPIAGAGGLVYAGDWLGEVDEMGIPHKIMVPFKFKGKYTVVEVMPAGNYCINDTIAVLKNEKGENVNVTMVQTWPVKIPIKSYVDKIRPSELFETGVRVIDTLNPILEGGTGFIPGPFGSGKTVLQHALAKQAVAEVVIIAACGERANEVVEIFTEFPELEDPRTGRKLTERTSIVANTSNMPVAAREASVYTAMTIAEYYRAMGLRTLLLADSTSRWAQALREMSNRLEELPGPDAYPMDLQAIISNYYSRAGQVLMRNGKKGSVTFIGTVSPAGGNLLEPVTEATKKVARCFFALSQERADSKRYPAIDPLDSYSKYLEYPEFAEYSKKNVAENWIEEINIARGALTRGREVYEQINILGDDGVPVDYHVMFWKSELIDFVFLQQNAFDEIDANTSVGRQKYMLEIVNKIVKSDFTFEKFEEVGAFFKRVIYIIQQINYSEFKSEKFHRLEAELQQVINQKVNA
ncbi:V-type ATP synthase subunit A [hydrothermal vent metagenome]|uniref:V-type ATP synthase subunit A n=1 Tax=hydrothermal vent metagenome TaxID=652676 RepID=A0A3B0TI70_9ZZZZ